jgi:hypothetical protein
MPDDDQAISPTVIRKISILFTSIYRTFVFLNGVILMIGVYNLYTSDDKCFRTNFWFICMLTVNFWVMLLIFFMVSLCFKLCIMVAQWPSSREVLEGNAWIQSLLLFPLTDALHDDQDYEDIMAMAMQESMSNDQPSRSPPTLDKLLATELKWGFCMSTKENIQPTNECIICAHELSHTYPNFGGCVKLSCPCNDVFHKKCVLEWFHFNETDGTDTEPARVTCPSCRHAFTEMPSQD